MKTKTDLNKIPGMRDKTFCEIVFGSNVVPGKINLTHYPYSFKLARYIYLCAIKGYLEERGAEYVITFLIGEYAKKLERNLMKLKNADDELIQLRAIINRSSNRYPLLFRDYINGNNFIRFQAISRNKISIFDLLDLYNLLLRESYEHTEKKKSY